MNDLSHLPDIDKKLVIVFIARMNIYLHPAEKQTVLLNLSEFNSLTNHVTLDAAIATMTLRKGSMAFMEGYIWTEEQYLNNHSDTLTYFMKNMVIVEIGNQKVGIIQETEYLDSLNNSFFLN